MRMPSKPPKYMDIFSEIMTSNSEKISSLLSLIKPVDQKGRYLHWDKLQHIEPPNDFSNKEWWCGTKMARAATEVNVNLKDKKGNPLHFCSISQLQEALHWLDLHTAGSISADRSVSDPSTRKTYLIRSLVEESINSSQLEGASTTRHIAKEMIRQGRHPKDKSEQMIYNNFHAMQFIHEMKNEKLTPSIVLELHKIVTEDTLDDPSKAGQFRDKNDKVYVSDNNGEPLHEPPPAIELNERLRALCAFANAEDEKEFIHPVIRAIVLHFMLGYDHPFIDGNGRTARALFYWGVAKENYWLLEYTTISKIIKKIPGQYGKAFLLTETDDNDLTYFIFHQIDVLRTAVEELQTYFEEKIRGIENAERLLDGNKKLKGKLNFRQLSLLKHALKHPGFIYKINEHKNSHGIAYETSRKDLVDMSDKLRLFTKLKAGKSFIFLCPQDLEHRINSHR